jgi:hypothetical protein
MSLPIILITLTFFRACLAAHLTSLEDAINFNLYRHNSLKVITDIFKSVPITREGLFAISLILRYPRYDYSQHYVQIDELEQGRLEGLLKSEFITDAQFHDTIYSPMKLLHNIALALAIFMVTDGKSVSYKGKFFHPKVPPSYFVDVYHVNAELAIRMVEFVVDNQMDEAPPKWIDSLIEIVSAEHALRLFRKLNPREITKEVLEGFSDRFGDFITTMYLDPVLFSEEDLFIHKLVCTFALIIERIDGGETALTDESAFVSGELYDKVEMTLAGRDDRASMAIRLLMLGITFEERPEELRVKLLEFMAEKGAVSIEPHQWLSIARMMTRLKMDLRIIPDRHRPIEYLSMERRVEHWLYKSPLKMTDEDDLSLELFDPAGFHLSVNRLLTDGRRIVDVVISHAQQFLLTGAIPTSRDEELIANAVAFLIVERRKIRFGNFFSEMRFRFFVGYEIEPLGRAFNERLMKFGLLIFDIEEIRSVVDHSFQVE